MKKILPVLSAVLLLNACASVKPDYEVRDRMKGGEPSWIEDAEKAAQNKKEREEFRFYKADAENVNKKLCQQSAKANAVRKMAEEISQEIVSKFEEKNDSLDDNATAAVKDRLARNISTRLHGAREAGTYWERRAYKAEMGAAKDIEKFKCDCVVKMKVTVLEEALNAYKQQTLNSLKDADQKKAMAKAFDEVAEDLRESGD